MRFASALKNIRQLLKFYSFVLRNFKLLYGVTALTVAVLLVEYLVTSLMIPLASESASNNIVVQWWTQIIVSLGLTPNKAVWLWLFFLFMILRLLLGLVQVSSANFLARQVHRFLSERVYGRIVSEEALAEVYRKSVGYYITLAGDDTFRSGTIVFNSIQWLVSLTTAFVGMMVLFLFSKTAFLGLIVFLTLCSALVFSMFGIVMILNGKATNLSRELNTLFIESLNSLRSIRVLGAEQFVKVTYKEQIHSYVRLLLEMEVVRSLMRILPAILLLGGGVIFLWPGGRFGLGYAETTVFAVTVILIRIFVSLGQLVSNSSLLFADVRAIRDIESLLEAPVASSTGNSLDDDNVEISKIRLQDIVYGYSSENIIINKLTVQFQRGNVYAVTGPSGSGKSTLADIILGFIKPLSGDVYYENAEKQVSANHRMIMLVEQQTRVFSTTIRENLLLGLKREADELWRVLDLVGLGEYVRSLPTDLDTKLDYQGSNMSGGQRQRLGIARALLHKPQVLILDEATSALDPVTKSKVLQNLIETMENGILIFITHELTVSEMADVIIPIGGIVATQ